jgi:molecular chaperone GrpE (heat shock protein)
MSKTEATLWAPLQDAVAQARNLDERARKIARQTADEVYNRSEALLQTAQKRSASAVKTVRKSVEQAIERLEARAPVRFAEVPAWARKQVGKQIDEARKQLADAETQLLRGVETVARSLHLAVEKDVDSLRRKLHQLEKRVGELDRESKAA